MIYKYMLLSLMFLFSCNINAFDEVTLKKDANDSVIVKTAKVIARNKLEEATIKAQADVKAANDLKPLLY